MFSQSKIVPQAEQSYCCKWERIIFFSLFVTDHLNIIILLLEPLFNWYLLSYLWYRMLQIYLNVLIFAILTVAFGGSFETVVLKSASSRVFLKTFSGCEVLSLVLWKCSKWCCKLTQLISTQVLHSCKYKSFIVTHFDIVILFWRKKKKKALENNWFIVQQHYNELIN